MVFGWCWGPFTYIYTFDILALVKEYKIVAVEQLAEFTDILQRMIDYNDSFAGFCFKEDEFLQTLTCTEDGGTKKYNWVLPNNYELLFGRCCDGGDCCDCCDTPA